MGDPAILILSRYGPRGASSRLRFFQYVGRLRQASMSVTVSSFFDDRYLDDLYQDGRRGLQSVAAAYLRRVGVLLAARRFDLVWIEKETLPFLPGWFESWLSFRGIPYVVDYDDATFHTYDLHSSPCVRLLLASRLDRLLRGAACVVVGNSYLGDYVKAHGARRVEIVPTVVDICRYPQGPPPAGAELRVGWIGSPATARYLELALPALAELSAEVPMRLVTIGAPRLVTENVLLEQHAWAEDTEAELLRCVHVGIMPLPDTPWERGKCGYKLIQYMACGRPVVASPIGVNQDIVTPDVGFLAASEEQWVSALKRLAKDARLRERMGVHARDRAETDYSLQAVAPRVIELLQDAMRANRPA